MGKSVDGFFDRSQSARTAFEDYLSGEGNLPEDLKEAIAGIGSSSQKVQNLTLSAFLAKLMASTDADGKRRLGRLLETAKTLGVEDAEG